MNTGRHKWAGMVAALLVALVFVLGVGTVLAHDNDGYSHDTTIGYTNTDWMRYLPNDRLLSEMSIPGTHDTMANDKAALLTVYSKTQTMSLKTQLESGIRVLDIRAHNQWDNKENKYYFQIKHGPENTGHVFDEDVMDVVNDFLTEHDGETVLIKMKMEDHGSVDPNASDYDPDAAAWVSTYDAYMKAVGQKVWTGTDTNPTLGDVRGKIVILSNVAECVTLCGLKWSSFDVNGDWDIGGNWGLYDLWVSAQDQINSARGGSATDYYATFLSGASTANPVFPYFVASGHSSPQTDAPRLLTGTVVSKNDTSKWPDFPRVSCALGLCSIAFEGTNILAKDYIKTLPAYDRVGMVMSDFPGAGLISSVIAKNEPAPATPPDADAGGPYDFDEGTMVLLDAGETFDMNYNDTLKYRWDFTADGSWDTEWSTEPTLEHRYGDDFVGSVKVEVSDGQFTDAASAGVTITNVKPQITSFYDANKYLIGEGEYAEIEGYWYDPAGPDDETYTGKAEWSDGVETPLILKNGYWFQTSRFFGNISPPPGADSVAYTVKITIWDKDGEEGSSTSPTIEVYNDPPQIDGITFSRDWIREGEEAEVVAWFSDPSLGWEDFNSETYSGKALWSDGVETPLDVYVGQARTFRTFADDYPDHGTAEDKFTVNITIRDSDGSRGTTATSPPLTVGNERPVIDSMNVDQDTISEGESVTVSGTFWDYGLGAATETFSGTALWNDGESTKLLVKDGKFQTSRLFADDNLGPGTPQDTYTVDITIRDDDGGISDTWTSPSVTVQNVAPVIESINASTEWLYESMMVSVSGTFSDPALSAPSESYSGLAMWSDGISTAVTVAEGKFVTERTFEDDHPGSGTIQDDFNVKIRITDDDGGSDSATSPDITVRNLAPLIYSIEVDATLISEGEQVVVSGEFYDPALLAATETFTLTALWSDGVTSTKSISSDGQFSFARRFADDDPSSGTASDEFTVDVTIVDDDGGSGTATSPIVTVYNENPVASIDSATDETGAEVADRSWPVLINTRIDLRGSFTDAGKRDTHTASVDWGDGRSNSGSTTGSIAVSHVYTVPGLYTAVMQVTDDDTGVGEAQTLIRVIDSADALSMLVDNLAGGTGTLAARGGSSQVLSAARLAKSSDEQMTVEMTAAAAAGDQSDGGPIAEAIDKLSGSDGALEMLQKDNLNAALVKMWQAMQLLQTAEAGDPGLDLAPQKNLLALTAKSTAVQAVLESDAAATKNNEKRKVDAAYGLIDDGDAQLAALNYVGAVDTYREAAQEVQGIK